MRSISALKNSSPERSSSNIVAAGEAVTLPIAAAEQRLPQSRETARAAVAHRRTLRGRPGGAPRAEPPRQLQDRIGIRRRKAARRRLFIGQPQERGVLARRQRHFELLGHLHAEPVLGVVDHAFGIAMAELRIDLVFDRILPVEQRALRHQLRRRPRCRFPRRLRASPFRRAVRRAGLWSPSPTARTPDDRRARSAARRARAYG